MIQVEGDWIRARFGIGNSKPPTTGGSTSVDRQGSLASLLVRVMSHMLARPVEASGTHLSVEAKSTTKGSGGFNPHWRADRELILALEALGGVSRRGQVRGALWWRFLVVGNELNDLTRGSSSFLLPRLL